MADPHALLVRDQLVEDAIALAADAVRAEAVANVLDRIGAGNGAERRAEGERIRRASDVCLLLAGFDDAVLDQLADGSLHKMLHEARQAAKRRKAIGGAR